MNKLRWIKTVWGWNMETANVRCWCAQVDRVGPFTWRVWNGNADLVAGGEARTTNIARRRAKAVLRALYAARY